MVVRRHVQFSPRQILQQMLRAVDVNPAEKKRIFKLQSLEQHGGPGQR